MPHSRRTRLAHRLSLWGWLALLVSGVATGVATMDTVERYTGARIELREWMQFYNAVILSAHGLALIPVLIGCALCRLPLHRPGTGLLRLGACLFLGAGLLAILAMLLFPAACGGGPFSPNGWQIQLLRYLVFLPGVLRGLGWLLFAGALWQSRPHPGEPGSVLSLWLSAGVLCCALGDVLLIAHKAYTTEKTILACVHPLHHEPVGLLPWIAGGLLSIALLSRLGKTPAA